MAVVSVFLMFGVGVQIVLLGYAVWIIYRILKFLKKSKKWGKDYDALLWSRAVIDPDGPARVRQEHVGQYRLGRKGKAKTYTGKHPRLRKWAKRTAIINLILVLIVVSLFMIWTVLPGLLFSNIPTRTEVTVYYNSTNLNLTMHAANAGWLFELANTSENGGTYPGGTIGLNMGIKRMDSSEDARDVVLNLTSGIFNGTPYVVNVTLFVLNQGTGNLEEQAMAKNNIMFFTATVPIKPNSELIILVFIEIASFDTSQRDTYLTFRTTGGDLGSSVSVRGGYYIKEGGI